MPVGFFNPTTNDLPAWVSDGAWCAQTEENSRSVERAQALCETGNEVASDLYGGKTSRTLSLKCTRATGNLLLPTVGEVFDTGSGGKGWHVDSFSLELSPTDWPTLSLQLHAHDGKAHSPCRVFTPSLTLPAGRGIPRAVGGFGLNDLGVGFASFSYECTTNHVDTQDGDGEFLAADNYDGSETVSLGTTGVGTVTAPSGWDETESSVSRGNTTNDSTSHSYVKHVPMTAPADTSED